MDVVQLSSQVHKDIIRIVVHRLRRLTHDLEPSVRTDQLLKFLDQRRVDVSELRLLGPTPDVLGMSNNLPGRLRTDWQPREWVGNDASHRLVDLAQSRGDHSIFLRHRPLQGPNRAEILVNLRGHVVDGVEVVADSLLDDTSLLGKGRPWFFSERGNEWNLRHRLLSPPLDHVPVQPMIVEDPGQRVFLLLFFESRDAQQGAQVGSSRLVLVPIRALDILRLSLVAPTQARLPLVLWLPRASLA